jgi:hypothetical protein
MREVTCTLSIPDQWAEVRSAALLASSIAARTLHRPALAPRACRLFLKVTLCRPKNRGKVRTRPSAVPPRSLSRSNRPLRDEPQYHLGMLVQRRYAPSARLDRGAPSLAPALQLDARARSDAETLHSLAPRRPLVLHINSEFSDGV